VRKLAIYSGILLGELAVNSGVLFGKAGVKAGVEVVFGYQRIHIKNKRLGHNLRLHFRLLIGIAHILQPAGTL
jgi:hypothetical protein